MRKYITAGVLLVATISIAFAQTTSPRYRANITPQTHCKDKAGHAVRLLPSSQPEGRNMTEVAGTLPDCP
jgi:hypothetical protein